MIYDAYQTYADAMLPMRSLAAAATWFLEGARPWFGEQVMLRGIAAGCDMLDHAGINHVRPSFGIDRVVIGGREVAVSEVVTDTKPFCHLLHFKRRSLSSSP